MATSLEELKQYRKELLDIYKGNATLGKENKDACHNVIVESVFLDNCAVIEMYCGKMSIFRQPLYDRISRENDKDTVDFIEKQSYESLKKFISNDSGCIKIYVQKYSPKLLRDLRWAKDFKDGILKGRIKIFAVQGNKLMKNLISHITLGVPKEKSETKSMVRQETDSDERSAICLFNIPKDLKKGVRDIFNKIESDSCEIDYSPLMS